MPSLTSRQFEVLAFLERTKEKKSQREIAKKTNISLGSVSSILEFLTNEQLIDGLKLTPAGYEALEPYRVKRAIFIAAGLGSRLFPLTINTPKPLIRVNGVRMIDTVLDAVVKAGIEEIYVVRGYLAEQFDQLLYKYPMIKFIENPIYNESNNIASTFFARHLFCNAYLLESDLVLSNPELIRKYQYTSNYLAVPVDKTDDWCFNVKNKVITKLSVGGVNCYHMFGISYWNEEDGKKLENDIKTVFEHPGGKERFWDQVPLKYCISNYRVEIRQCTFDDIAEVDTYNDLNKLDNSYSRGGL